MDSSAIDHHVNSNDNFMISKAKCTGFSRLAVGNGVTLPISHISVCHLPTYRPLALRNILLVPSIEKNRISISKFTSDNDAIVEFNSSSCFVKDKIFNVTLLTYTLHEGLHQLDLAFSSLSSASLFESSNHLTPIVYNASATSPPCSSNNKNQHVISLFHNRLGHPNSYV